MASTHIEIIGGSRTSNALRGIIANLQKDANEVKNLTDAFYKMAEGQDFETLAQRLDLRIPEGEVGAGEPDAATAETVYNIIIDLNSILNPPAASPNAVSVALSRMY